MSDAFVWSKPQKIVTIGDNIYCRSRKARREVLHHLRLLGYRVDDRVKGGGYDKEPIPLATINERRAYRYFARLDIMRGKCGSCGQYISTLGIRSHGHTCEKCGAVTYRELIDGSTMTFSFLSDSHEFWGPKLRLKTKKWEDEYVWFYTSDMQGEHGLGQKLTQEQIDLYLAAHADKWCYDEIGGQKFIKIFYEGGYRTKLDQIVIETSDVWGSESNHSIVQVYRGVEYSEYERLPVPDSLHIYETWHWKRLTPSPDLHEELFAAVRQVSDCGYYHQDGRAVFNREVFERMGTYVKYFTTLDYDAWQRLVPRIPLDGPGSIVAIARFCHPQPRVKNEPNIGNVLVVMGKVASGQQPTIDEIEAAEHGLTDPDIRQIATDMIIGFEMSQLDDELRRL